MNAWLCSPCSRCALGLYYYWMDECGTGGRNVSRNLHRSWGRQKGWAKYISAMHVRSRSDWWALDKFLLVAYTSIGFITNAMIRHTPWLVRHDYIIAREERQNGKFRVKFLLKKLRWNEETQDEVKALGVGYLHMYVFLFVLVISFLTSKIKLYDALRCDTKTIRPLWYCRR